MIFAATSETPSVVPLVRDSNRFLYVRIRDLLLAQLEELKPGDKFPSELYLHRTYKVHRETIRRALKDLIDQGLIYRVPACGTFVANPGGAGLDQVRMGRGTAQIAWIIRTRQGLVVEPFHAEMFETASLEWRPLRYGLTLFSVNEDDDFPKKLSKLHSQEFAGIMLVGNFEREQVKSVLELDVPTVLIDHAIPDLPVDSVVPDHEGGAREAVRFLIAQGHRRIGCIRMGDLAAVHERFQGYQQALAESGIPVDMTLVVDGGVEKAMARWLQAPDGPPTAVFCLNDDLALRAIHCIRQMGLKVPETISVVGFDDLNWAVHCVPPLTTVRIPRGDLIRSAIRLLTQRMKRERTSHCKTVLSTTLISRASVALFPLSKGV